MSETLLQVLLEGGALAVFVIFVIYMGKEQTKERANLSIERKENTEVMLKLIKDGRERGNNQMAIGMDALDKVVVSIDSLAKVNASLAQVVAVHDQKSDSKMERVLDRLEHIKNGG